MVTRGIRNNNPGNIRIGADWDGLARSVPEYLPEEKSFCQFRAPQYGIRAMTRIIQNYERKHGINTVKGIINRWAPPIENDTGSYVASVAHQVGQGPDEVISTDLYDHMNPLISAIIRHENGHQPYPPALVDWGLSLAGIRTPDDWSHSQPPTEVTS